MIKDALEFLRDQLNEYLRRDSISDLDLVQLANVVDQDGSTRPNVLTLTLVNIEEETVVREPFTYREQGQRAAPSELWLNLYVLATACVSNSDLSNGKSAYADALGILSKAVGFFQAKPYFTAENSPALQSNLDKLMVKLVSSSSQDLNNLWGCLGAKYMPSALYKVRVVSFDGDELQNLRPVIEEFESSVTEK